MRLFPAELYILKLKRRLPGSQSLDWLREMTDDECLAELKEEAGQDLGTDVAAYEQWWKRERERMEIDPDF